MNKPRITNKEWASKPDKRATLPVSSQSSASSASLYRLISRQPFFKGLRPEYLKTLARLAMETQFAPGQYIFRQGDPANRFYLILEGKVEVESTARHAVPIPFRTLGPGDDLGWSWLFEPYYFYVNARAVEPTTAIFFYGTILRQQCENDHGLGYEIMKRIAGVAIKSLLTMQQTLGERSRKRKQTA